MRLIRFEVGGVAMVGVEAAGRYLDIAGAAGLSGMASMRGFLSSGGPAMEAAARAVAKAEGCQDQAWSYSPADARLLAPIDDPQKIICVGQNYRDHCAEQQQPLPERPILFAKYPSAIIGPEGLIRIPRISSSIDYEAELAFVISRRGRYISAADAMDHVAGFMCLNDVTARDIQYSDKQWVRGKTFDTFAPIGPAIVTPDEVGDPENLEIRLELNGAVMQKSNTNNLVFGIRHLVSYISDTVTLEPGDIVTTGTPGGVGWFREPRVLLKPGDRVEVSVARIGVLRNTVAAEPEG